MAKLGEGDQRWIVKERDDGANCNGWHWSEKNLTEWSKERLGELLGDIVVFEDSTGSCKVTELEKMTGDVTVQSRKQKKFPLYELEITVTLEEESNEKRPLKESVRLKGAPLIRQACMASVKELKENVGLSKEMTAKRPPPTERANNTYVVSSAEQTKTSQVKINYDFVPPPQVLYDTLLDTNRIRGCTASDATMSREVGGKFSMFSGAVDGENVELRPFSESSGDAMIKWKWRFSTWQPDHYSTVTITLTDKDGATKLELVQTGVPEEERERTEKGWKGLLFDRMKAMLGGSVMG